MTPSYVGQLLAAPLDQGNFTDTNTVNVRSTGLPTLQANDVVVWYVNASGNSPVTSASDARGNTYSVLGTPFYDSSTAMTLSLVAGTMSTVLQAGDAMSFGFGAGKGVPCLALPVVFRGVQVSLDGTPGGNDSFGGASSATPWTTPSISTTAQPELFLSMAGVVASYTDTAISGFTDIVSFHGTNDARTLIAQYGITSSTGAIHGGGVVGSNDSFNAFGAVLKAASGPTPNPQIGAGFFAA